MISKILLPNIILLLTTLMFSTSTGTADETLIYFGYSAVNCGLDDPHDNSDKTNYTEEVAQFTNLNQVCIDASTAVTASRLRNSARYFTPLFYVQPIFFNSSEKMLSPNTDSPLLLNHIHSSIAQSGVSPKDIIFYLADEPTLRHLPLADLEAAAQTLRFHFPKTPIMVIEAYHEDGLPPIAQTIDYWGFNAYTLPDPSQDLRYTTYLDQAAAELKPHQSLVMVMDAQHTPYHQVAGLSATDMAEVARAYYAYAIERSDIVALLGYTWAGGIDGTYEKGVRDMPVNVIQAHREIGLAS